MLKKFKTKELIFIAIMAAALLVINLAFGSAIIAITGIPMSNMILTGITFGLFLLLMVKTLPKFGTFTLFLLVYSVLEIPTPLGGAPGFWPKVPINVITGLVADLILIVFKYKKWSYYPSFYILVTVNTFVFIYFMKLFNVPGVNEFMAIVWWAIPLYWVLGTIGIFIGFAIHKKIKKNKTYMQISS